jgi:site-specific DNA recombinase
MKQFSYKMNSIIAAIYVRDSTNNRESIQRQIEDCRIFAEQNGMEIFNVYEDREVLLNDCNSQKFQYVIVFSLDRLSRKIKEVIKLVASFESRNIKIRSVKENFPLPSITSIQLRIFQQIADFERQMQEEREMIESAVEEFLPA